MNGNFIEERHYINVATLMNKLKQFPPTAEITGLVVRPQIPGPIEEGKQYVCLIFVRHNGVTQSTSFGYTFSRED